MEVYFVIVLMENIKFLNLFIRHKKGDNFVFIVIFVRQLVTFGLNESYSNANVVVVFTAYVCT